MKKEKLIEVEIESKMIQADNLLFPTATDKRAWTRDAFRYFYDLGRQSMKEEIDSKISELILKDANTELSKRNAYPLLLELRKSIKNPFGNRKH
jgi:hypothetical protein